MNDPWLLIGHAAATWALVGLIWTVQVVQYPGLARVPEEDLRAHHQHHMRAIAWVVAPLMSVEAVLAAVIALAPPDCVPPGAAWTGLGLVGLTWLSTALVQVPLHGRLKRTVGRASARRLVRSNWIRTAAWSGRGLLSAQWLALAVGA